MTHDTMIKERVCMRCGHKWYPRSLRIPKICPSCKSTYWANPGAMVRKRRIKALIDHETAEELKA